MEKQEFAWDVNHDNGHRPTSHYFIGNNNDNNNLDL